VPGEAVDAQALEEADLEAPADETAADAPAGDTAEAPADAEAAEDRG
jgi:hypothetical protein